MTCATYEAMHREIKADGLQDVELVFAKKLGSVKARELMVRFFRCKGYEPLDNVIHGPWLSPDDKEPQQA